MDSSRSPGLSGSMQPLTLIPPDLNALNAQALRDLTAGLLKQVSPLYSQRHQQLRIAGMNRKILGALAISFGISSAAFGGSFVCPTGPGPGERQIGMAGGSPGVAPVPMCVQDAQSQQQSQPGRTADPQADAAAGLAKAMGSLATSQIYLLEDMNKTAQDPEFRKLRTGYWSYFHDTQQPSSGQKCVALFQNLKGAVQLSGPGSSYKGAMLTLMGLDIPKPSTVAHIKVTLDQGDGNPQTVNVFNYAVAQGKLGAVSFGIPTAEALLQGMTKNDMTFKVSVDGKQVIDTFYHDGLQAREQLRLCLAGRPKI